MWETLERIGLIISLIAFAVLGYFSYSNFNNNQQINLRFKSIENSLQRIIQVPDNNATMNQFNNECDAACVRKIVDDAIASISGISNQEKEQVAEKIAEKVIVPISQPRTQYVPLGAGSTSNTTWTDAPGAQVTFNVADFGNISQIYFEAQLSSPSGLVYARLWDNLSGGMIPGSEISALAGDAQLVSTKVSIPTGGRTIKVQLKSQVQQPVSVLQSRLRIDTK